MTQYNVPPASNPAAGDVNPDSIQLTLGEGQTSNQTVSLTGLSGGSLTLGAREEYAQALASRAGSQEDAWQRAVELLFERLAVRWTIAGLPVERQDELIGRYRMATAAERAWVRDVLREHVAANFPELQAP